MTEPTQNHNKADTNSDAANKGGGPVIPPLPPIPIGTPPPMSEIPPLPAVQKTPDIKTKKHKIIWEDVLSCWVLGIGFLLLLLSLLLFALAKSGILTIPVLSYFYNAPTPVRYIEAGEKNWDEFRGMIKNRILEQGVDVPPPVPLDISEQEFTELLHDVVKIGLRDQSYEAEVAQVAITPEYIELYFHLKWKTFFQFEILAKLVPVVQDDGTLMLEVVQAKFGDLPLPGVWSLRIIGYFFARDVGAWKIILSNGYGIQDTELSEGNIRLLIGPVLTQ